VLAGDTTAKWNAVVLTDRETDGALLALRYPPAQDDQIWLKHRGLQVLCKKVSPDGQYLTFERHHTDEQNSFIAQSCDSQVFFSLSGVKTCGAPHLQCACPPDTIELHSVSSALHHKEHTGTRRTSWYVPWPTITVRSTFHTHFECPIVGCKFVGTRLMASKHSTGPVLAGAKTLCAQWWRLE